MGVRTDIRVEPQLVLFNDQTIRQPNLRQQQQRMMHRRARKRRIARHQRPMHLIARRMHRMPRKPGVNRHPLRRRTHPVRRQ
ncbi:MAG: hypothetical protein SPK06_01240 [Kiritimatiellia bacterium]|nr:hypothetical protein [Kiritimatiellia bacterium]